MTGTAAQTERAFGLDQTLFAPPGYDDTTGVGMPDARYFASYLRTRPSRR